MSRYVLSATARRDLVEAALFIADESGNPDLGERLIGYLKKTCEIVAGAPRIGRPRFDLRARMRSYVVRPYVIFYRPASDHVVVMRIVHERRDLAEIFPKKKRK